MPTARRRRKGGRVPVTAVLLAALVVAAGPAPTAVADPSAGGSLPGAVADPSLDAAILVGQLRALAVGEAPATTAAAGAVAGDDREVTAASSRLGTDRTRRGEDRRTVDLDTATATETTATATAAGVQADRATAARAAARQALATLAVDWYAGAAAGVPATAAASAPSAVLARHRLDRVTGKAETGLGAATVVEERSEARAAGAAATAERARRAEGAAKLALTRIRHAVVTTGQALAAARHRLASDTEAQRALARADAAARRAVIGPESGAAPVPSILGASAVTAADMAAWIEAEGFFPTTRTPVERLARWYLQLGRTDGVRGDLAFVQATLETGGFSSTDAVDRNDFAGIGHCDTCRAATSFPTARSGVAAQLQLLAEMAGSTPPPVAVPGVTAGARARTCPTWNSLTGVWATDPDYGAKILGLYSQLLGFSIDRGGGT